MRFSGTRRRWCAAPSNGGTRSKGIVNTLGKAIRQGQAEGTVGVRGFIGNGDTERTTISPRKFLAPGTTTVETYAMADAGDDAFEEALAEAKAEGNVSRANVVRKLTKQKETKETTVPSVDAESPSLCR